ncbi:MAG: DTW domain-containing protein [Xanthomonadaceae bacterium]|nr:DTW domain-containing protein [Xanthomonadaceae bacterium]
MSLKILCLQHPQEPDKHLGTVPLLKTTLGDRLTLKVGLSWPNLSKAVGAEAKPSEWLALFIGSRKKAEGAWMPDERGEVRRGLHWINPKSKPAPDDLAALKGIIVLDGTWSQGKTLWWRNAWLLKCKQAFLIPLAPSAYGRMRKEPGPECVSTLECVAETLTLLGEKHELEKELREKFAEFLKLKKQR